MKINYSGYSVFLNLFWSARVNSDNSSIFILRDRTICNGVSCCSSHDCARMLDHEFPILATARNGYLTDASASERTSDFRCNFNEPWPWRRKLRERRGPKWLRRKAKCELPIPWKRPAMSFSRVLLSHRYAYMFVFRSLQPDANW